MKPLELMVTLEPEATVPPSNGKAKGIAIEAVPSSKALTDTVLVPACPTIDDHASANVEVPYPVTRCAVDTDGSNSSIAAII